MKREELHEKISVIIPAHNAEKTIERCLDSIIAQSYENLEIIVIDDGSNDLTLSVLTEIAKKDKRIKVLSKENGGASSARNEGLRIASGDFITFLDADDYIEKQVYEKLYRELRKNDFDIVSASIREIYNDNSIEERINPNGVTSFTGKEALCCMFTYSKGIRTVVWDKLYKRSILQNIFFDESSRYGEDTLFNCQAILRCKRYGTISYIGYTYDHRESQMTGHVYTSAILSNVNIIDKMIKIIREDNCNRYNTEEIGNSLTTYKITIYRQLFQYMLQVENLKKIEKDYLYLKEKAKKIRHNELRKNLSTKHKIQWIIYLYFFREYRFWINSLKK